MIGNEMTRSDETFDKLEREKESFYLKTMETAWKFLEKGEKIAKTLEGDFEENLRNRDKIRETNIRNLTNELQLLLAKAYPHICTQPLGEAAGDAERTIKINVEKALHYIVTIGERILKEGYHMISEGKKTSDVMERENMIKENKVLRELKSRILILRPILAKLRSTN
ncbi:hypothetical protein JW949_04370 [Candidatus Woesearchaeota archaeon]|nr:hypothetical protein [Candidatus Woesearchaeota archaeon]